MSKSILMLMLLGTLAIMALYIDADFLIQEAFIGMLLCAGSAIADTAVISTVVKFATGKFMPLPVFALIYIILLFCTFVIFRIAQYLGDKYRNEEDYLWHTQRNS